MAITHDTDGNPYDDKILQLVSLCNDRNRRSIRDKVPFFCTPSALRNSACSPTDYDVYIDFMIKCFKSRNLSDDLAHDLLYLVFDADRINKHDCTTDVIMRDNIGLSMNEILRLINPAFASSFNINEIQWRLVNHYTDNLRILLILDDANIRIDYDYIYTRANDVYRNGGYEHYAYSEFELHDVFNEDSDDDVKSLSKAINLLTDVIRNVDNMTSGNDSNKVFFANNILDLLLTYNRFICNGSSFYTGVNQYVNEKFPKMLIKMLMNDDESFTIDLSTPYKQSQAMQSFQWLSSNFDAMMKNPSRTITSIGLNKSASNDYDKMRIFIIFMAYYHHVSKQNGYEYGSYDTKNILAYIKQLNDGYPDEYAYENLKVNQDKTDADRTVITMDYHIRNHVNE